MKTFLVPTDFSETSKNAARYAAHIAKQYPDIHIILYNVSDEIAAGTDGSPLADDDHSRHKVMELALESVKIDLSKITQSQISCVAEEGTDLIDSIDKFCRHRSVDMIIMGITGSTRLEQIFMGSNTLKMVNRGTCPVMIVPPFAQFKGIQDIVLTSDFKDVERTMPAKPIQKVLDFFRANLHVVNVDSEHYVEVTDEYKEERAKLENILQPYNPQFYFIRMYDFVDAVNQFVEDKEIDLILTVPKKHSFLTNIFRSSYTKKLAYHSHVPIIAVHE
ncbi:MAG TPA: universal stress protein [Chitinophagaceae bacterium]|nr:universal stress protein [Chitinophagaceae bacterium]